MTINLYKSTNVLTDTSLTTPFYIVDIFNQIGAVSPPAYCCLRDSGLIYRREGAQWVYICNVSEFNDLRGTNSFVKFKQVELGEIITNYSHLAQKYDVVSGSPDVIYTGTEWIQMNQEGFNLQILQTISDLAFTLNEVLGEDGDIYNDLVIELNKLQGYLNDIRAAITEKSQDPGPNVSDYADAIRGFNFIPYAFTRTTDTVHTNIANYPGYFLNTMKPNTAGTALEPNASNLLQLPANGWVTGYNMYYNGDFAATRVYNSVWNDYAEFFEKDDKNYKWEEGEVISVNKETGKYRISQGLDDDLVIGVVTQNFGHILGGNQTIIEDNYDEFIPVALAGRIPVKTDYAAKIGDVLVASREKGKATYADDNPKPGTVLGVVVELGEDKHKPIMFVRRS